MSIPVELPTLANVMKRYRFAYLMTTSANGGAPHAVAVSPVLAGSELVVNDLGRRSRANAVERPAVALVWPPQIESDYSLIVDGQAAVIGDSMRIAPVRAVLHRSAPAQAQVRDDAKACASDCVPIDLGVGTAKR